MGVGVEETSATTITTTRNINNKNIARVATNSVASKHIGSGSHMDWSSDRLLDEGL